MSLSRIQSIFCAVGVLAIFWGNSSDDRERQANLISVDASGDGSHDTRPNTSAGYECTENCSGHEAGYAWAKEHDISDAADCDTAGEHSNSPSFAEGCHAYVDGYIERKTE